MFPAALTYWSSWKKSYPQTTVLPGDGVDGFMGTYRGMEAGDAAEFGLAVIEQGTARLYPYPALAAAGVVHDEIQDRPVAVVLSQAIGVARAFDCDLDGEVLTFERLHGDEEEVLLKDQQTDSVWDALTGIALEGAFEGEELRGLVCYPILVDRFEALFPDGSTWTPRPANPGGSPEGSPGQ